MKDILIDASFPDEYRVAVLENSLLIDFDSQNNNNPQQRGSIFLGKVHKIEISLQAAFIEISEGMYGFLPLSEIALHYFNIPEDMKKGIAQSENPTDFYKKFNINEALRLNDILLVQVTKDKRYNKGVTLTTKLKIPGRYCILTPYINECIISKQIVDEAITEKLKNIANKNFDFNKNIGVILRAYAAHATEKQITYDYAHLVKIWKEITANAKQSSSNSDSNNVSSSNNSNDQHKQQTAGKLSPSGICRLLYKEGDLMKKVIRDWYSSDVRNILINDFEECKKLRKYAKDLLYGHKVNIKLYSGKKALFEQYKVEEQITSLFRDKVLLKSGGSLIINTTEALTAIDVNSGKMNEERDIEETAFRTNMSAALEIARQTELRGISGIIVIDFIDMHNFKYIKSVEKVLIEEFRKYQARVQVSQINRFGLVAVSRQRTKSNFIEINTEECSNCSGSGRVASKETCARQVFRAIYNHSDYSEINVETSNSELAIFLLNQMRGRINQIEKDFNLCIKVSTNKSLSENSLTGVVPFRVTATGERLPSKSNKETTRKVPTNEKTENNLSDITNSSNNDNNIHNNNNNNNNIIVNNNEYSPQIEKSAIEPEKKEGGKLEKTLLEAENKINYKVPLTEEAIMGAWISDFLQHHIIN